LFDRNAQGHGTSTPMAWPYTRDRVRALPTFWPAAPELDGQKHKASG